MKKSLVLILIFALLPALPNIIAYAADSSPIDVSVPVEIEQGGTAVIIPEVNCPLPDKTELKLADREVGRFNIHFTETGVFTYAVKVMPDERKLNFDTTVYTVKVFVTDEGGTLSAVTIVYINDVKYSGRTGSDGTPDCLIFTNTFLPPDKTTEPSTETRPIIPVPTTRSGGRTVTTNPAPTTSPGGIITPTLPNVTTAPGRRERPARPETTTTTKPDRSNDPARPDSTTEPDNPPRPDKNNPKTSDDSRMEMYFIIAMIASAGLLMLSIIYAADCRKLIKAEKNRK